MEGHGENKLLLFLWDVAKVSSHVRTSQLSSALVVIVFLQVDDGSAAMATVTPLELHLTPLPIALY